jgi:hypothetical protein
LVLLLPDGVSIDSNPESGFAEHWRSSCSSRSTIQSSSSSPLSSETPREEGEDDDNHCGCAVRYCRTHCDTRFNDDEEEDVVAFVPRDEAFRSGAVFAWTRCSLQTLRTEQKRSCWISAGSLVTAEAPRSPFPVQSEMLYLTSMRDNHLDGGAGLIHAHTTVFIFVVLLYSLNKKVVLVPFSQLPRPSSPELLLCFRYPSDRECRCLSHVTFCGRLIRCMCTGREDPRRFENHSKRKEGEARKKKEQKGVTKCSGTSARSTPQREGGGG